MRFNWKYHVYISIKIWLCVFLRGIVFVRQSLEKNIEKVVAIALSLGMVALNTCSNGGYSYRVNSTSSDKNNGNIAYASELTSPEANNLVESDDLESREAPQEIKSLAPAVVDTGAPKIKVSSQPKVIVKKSINHDVDVTTPAIDDEPLDMEEDIWDKLIKDYEKYEIKDVDNVDIPDEDDPVNIDDDIAEPIDDPADLETKPDVKEDVAPDVTDDVNNSEDNTKDVLTESEIMPDPVPEIEPKVEEKPETELTPVLVVTPFGTHIEVEEKPVDTKTTTETTKIEDVEKPESDPKDTETISEPANDNVNIVIMNENDEFLSKIPEEGVNGYSKDLIKTLLYSGLGITVVAAIIGVSAWLIYK